MPVDAVILGLGYVGLPLARAATGAGLSVVGVDIDPERVATLASGLSHTVRAKLGYTRGVTTGDTAYRL